MDSLLKLLGDLEAECFAEGASHPYGEGVLREILANPAYRILIACPDRVRAIPLPSGPDADGCPCPTPAGYLIARQFREDGFEELYRLGVPNRFRRKGWGRRLLGEWIQRGRESAERGTGESSREGRLRLEVSETNEAARNLYESMGFFRTGLRRNYYPDGSAALIYDFDLFA